MNTLELLPVPIPLIWPVEESISIEVFLTPVGIVAPSSKLLPASKLYSNFDKSDDIWILKSPSSLIPILPSLRGVWYSTVWLPSYAVVSLILTSACQ